MESSGSTGADVGGVRFPAVGDSVLEHVESGDGVVGTTSWVRFTTAAAVRREPNPPLGSTGPQSRSDAATATELGLPMERRWRCALAQFLAQVLGWPLPTCARGLPGPRKSPCPLARNPASWPGRQLSRARAGEERLPQSQFLMDSAQRAGCAVNGQVDPLVAINVDSHMATDSVPCLIYARWLRPQQRSGGVPRSADQSPTPRAVSKVMGSTAMSSTRTSKCR